MDAYWKTIPGWFDFQDLYDLAVDEASDGANFLEVGCWLGKSTCYLADCIRKSGKNIRLSVIDTFKGVEGDELQTLLTPFGGSVRLAFEANLKAAGFFNLVTMIEENSRTAHRHFAPSSLEFVFIDGDHSYQGIRQDVLNFRPKVKPGGILAGHDYRNSADVKRAVDELLGPCPASAASWAHRIPRKG